MLQSLVAKVRRNLQDLANVVAVFVVGRAVYEPEQSQRVK